jgi:hypothetical protein
MTETLDSQKVRGLKQVYLHTNRTEVSMLFTDDKVRAAKPIDNQYMIIVDKGNYYFNCCRW